MSETLASQKAKARKAASRRRREAHAVACIAASEALRAHLTGLSGRVVAGYLPIRSEADPVPAMAALVTANRVAVPVVEGPGRPLAFREWHPGCRLVSGPFGVDVPETGDALVPDYLIVPMLAFDDRLFRLGYGGGFYDRTLAELRPNGAQALGFAYAAQHSPVLPVEGTDMALDAVLTERGLWSV